MYSVVTKDILEAARFINEGRVVAFPTGTCYGLAVDALKGNSLQRLRNLKKRPEEKTFTVFLNESLWKDYFTLTVAEREFLVRNKNQAITLLVKPKSSLRHLAQKGRVGLRIIDHPIMQKLADQMSTPLTATSANLADKESCQDIDCIQESFPGKIDETTYDLSLAAILDGGRLPTSKPSTIIRLEKDKPKIIRPGAFTL